MSENPDPKPIEPSEEDRKAAAKWLRSWEIRVPSDEIDLARFRAQARAEERDAWVEANAGQLDETRKQERERRDAEWCRAIWPSDPEGMQYVGPQEAPALMREGSMFAIRYFENKARVEERERVIEECAKVALDMGENVHSVDDDSAFQIGMAIRALGRK